jgi:preprotein translocase subunit SecF
MSSFDDDIDFRRVWRVGITITVVAMVVSLGAIWLRGLNLGIDFEGGTSWDVPAADLSVEDARDALRGLGEEGAKIQVIGRGSSRLVRVQSTTEDPGQQSAVSDALAEEAGIDATDISESTVGPSWGDQVTEKAQRALVYFFIAIALYMAIRLEWKMAVGALASVVHDLVVSVGFYSLFQIEITPATVIAFLTILGYSLYDTIVVFDRIRENAARLTSTSRATYTDTVSLSLNQVLMRSINTTVTSLLPVLAMLVIGSYVLGAASLQEFAVALAVGLTSGAFSSIMVASPLVAWIKEREPRNRDLRARLASTRGPISSPVPAGAGAAPGASPSPVRPRSQGAAPPLSGRPIPPRPRKKGRKR